MSEKESYYSNERNLGKDCEYWEMGRRYPKFEIQGRTSCEGIIDPVCIFLKDGKKVEGFDLTEDQVIELKTSIPGNPHSIPAGRLIKL